MQWLRCKTGKKVIYILGFNRDRFNERLNDFDVLADSMAINNGTKSLSRSAGSTIDALNECFEAYNKYCEGINALYRSTGKYLHQALNNLDTCEADNKMTVSDRR